MHYGAALVPSASMTCKELQTIVCSVLSENLKINPAEIAQEITGKTIVLA